MSKVARPDAFVVFVTPPRVMLRPDWTAPVVSVIVRARTTKSPPVKRVRVAWPLASVVAVCEPIVIVAPACGVPLESVIVHIRMSMSMKGSSSQKIGVIWVTF